VHLLQIVEYHCFYLSAIQGTLALHWQLWSASILRAIKILSSVTYWLSYHDLEVDRMHMLQIVGHASGYLAAIQGTLALHWQLRSASILRSIRIPSSVRYWLSYYELQVYWMHLLQIVGHTSHYLSAIQGTLALHWQLWSVSILEEVSEYYLQSDIGYLTLICKFTECICCRLSNTPVAIFQQSKEHWHCIDNCGLQVFWETLEYYLQSDIGYLTMNCKFTECICCRLSDSTVAIFQQFKEHWHCIDNCGLQVFWKTLEYYLQSDIGLLTMNCKFTECICCRLLDSTVAIFQQFKEHWHCIDNCGLQVFWKRCHGTTRMILFISFSFLFYLLLYLSRSHCSLLFSHQALTWT